MVRWLVQRLVLLASLVLTAAAGQALIEEVAVTQSIIWLPTGVAIGGIWLLGLRSWWVVALATAMHRLTLDYHASVIVPESLGSAAEAVLGVLVLRRIGMRADCARLRDVLALFACAAAVPFVSMAASLIGRSLPGLPYREMPLLSGWGGWWRMNALGALTVVPLVLTWGHGSRSRISARDLIEAIGLGLATVGLLWSVITVLVPGPTAITLLYAVLPMALYAALRFGPRGAVTVTSLAAVFVAVLTVHGHGPFLGMPIEERHVAAQIFELTLLCVPLVLGALIAERRRAQLLLGWQAEILELVARGRSTATVFEALLRGIEAFDPGGMAAILLRQGTGLRCVCGPSLPAAYRAALDQSRIAWGQGSCGTAAIENRTVVVGDIATDPLWDGCRDEALANGVLASWAVPLRGVDGAVLGTLGINYRTLRRPDAATTAMVERAAALAGIAMERERREDLLASIHRNVREGLYRGRQGQGLVYASPALAQLFGYDSPAALLQREVGAADAHEGHDEDLHRLASGGFAGDAEVCFRRRDGSTFWGLVSSTGVPGADGEPAMFDGTITDITGRKELEAQLRQSQKLEAIGKLAGGVAHDFNNLLTVVAGYGETIRDEAQVGSELRHAAVEIVDATGRAASLTRQLLAFSRQQVLMPQELDLAVVVAQLGGLLRRLIGADVQLELRHAGDAWVRADRGQVEQVLLNLCVNARDAMPGGGILTIATGVSSLDAATAAAVGIEPGDYVELSVQDTGVGMSAEVRARAFEPFFTTKAPGLGTGLGLATVYGIAKQSGGAVWLDSEPGAGTRVRLCLPRAAAPHAGAATVTPVAGGLSRRQAIVLLAEDERPVRELVRRTLERAGYTVLVAVDGQDALELAGRHEGVIDLLVTDVVMPRVGGFDLARRLARVGLPILFLSGYSADVRGNEAAAFPGSDYLCKPFAREELLSRVAALLPSG